VFDVCLPSLCVWLPRLQAKLHQWRPTMRYCRYRDLAKSIWGEPTCISSAACVITPVHFQVAASLGARHVHTYNRRLPTFV
jgi:hypothetical protein